MKFKIFAFLFIGIFGIFHLTFGQAGGNPWQDIEETDIPENLERQIIPSSYRTLKVNKKMFSASLNNSPKEFTKEVKSNPNIIKLPMPDGSFQRFRIAKSPVMAAELAAKYPEIQTYSGRGIDDPTATIRMDQTPKGFHAMILSQSGTVYIDPYAKGNNINHISYRDVDAPKQGFGHGGSCETDEFMSTHSPQKNTNPVTEDIGENLLVYRMALAADSVYSNFHGGTIPSVMAAMTTAFNRINAIFERDFAIRMELIPNNDLLIYLGSDPYSYNQLAAMLNQNQNNLDLVIGNSNYDIGHVFSSVNPASGTFVAGIAQLASVCRNNGKARGASSLPSPIGNGFIGVAAHEMGHQFSANHSYNTSSAACGNQRSSTSAYEPGGGSTIMSYAGACAPDNIASSQNLYFHTISHQQVINFSRNGIGGNCATSMSTGNLPPVTSVENSGFFIPIETPFVLRGSATDPNNDSLTYCWEQFNLGPAGNVNNPSGNAPIIRSYLPTDTAVRTIPRMVNIIFGSSVFGEMLPTYSRDLNFILTVRDNNPAGGGVDYDQISFKSTDMAGPFVVTEPNNGANWTAGTWQTVEWDVANTNAPPVNSFRVNILLSTDGGYTYPHVLATDELNIGTATVKVPNLPGFTNRIRVEAADNIFFDIADNNITIESPPAAGFAYYIEDDYRNTCAPSDLYYQIVTSSLLGFTNQVNLTTQNLPAGAVANFSSSTINPEDTTALTISNTDNISPGVYTFQVIGTATSGETETLSLTMEIQNNTPQPVTLGSPLNGAVAQAPSLTFFWVPFSGDQEYFFELATSPAFGASIIESALVNTNTFLITNTLSPLTPYFWRVSASNVCGLGPDSEIRAFQTATSGNTPAAPELITNLPLTVLQWQEEFISISSLQVSDGVSTAANLTYTLVDVPQNGAVELNGTSISSGNIFTQDDINTGKVKYQHDGSNTSSDAFTFTVHNANGGWLGTPKFQVVVTNTTNIRDEISGLNINLYPNPASNQVNIELTSELSEKIDIDLYTTHGQLINSKSLQLTNGTVNEFWNTSKLSSGIYLLKIRTKTGEVVKKLVIQK